MFIELTTRNSFGVTNRIMVSINKIVSIWEEENTVSIFTTESDDSFSVEESYDTIKFLLKIHTKVNNEKT